jgi:quercetin dioxygenase-like cupin family protein
MRGHLRERGFRKATNDAIHTAALSQQPFRASRSEGRVGAEAACPGAGTASEEEAATTMREAAEPVVLGPGEGTTYGRAGAWTLVTKATEAQTRGAHALQEMTVAPGFPWSPPHVHHNGDEAMYVLEGECTVRIGERVRTLGAGAFALMPRGSSTPSPTRGRRRPG